MRSLHSASQFLVALWVGALLCFAALVTPALFQAYSSDSAARAVRLILPRLDGITIALAAAAVLLSLRQPVRRARTSVLLVALAAGAVSLFWLTPAMAELRTLANDQMSLVAKDAPIRREFARLHGVSSALLLLEILLFATAFVLGARSPAITDRIDPLLPQ